MKRVCSECPNELSSDNPKARTCSTHCRQKRARRLKNAAKAVVPDETRDRARERVADEARNLAREELRPVVREAITEDVRTGIANLLGLTQKAVDAIGEDLGSEDVDVRQRAYSTFLRYTLGRADLTAGVQDTGGQMVVNFNLPRPDGPEVVVEATAIPDELVRHCEMCGQDKEPRDFVADSGRCINCQLALDARKDAILNAG